MDDYTWRKRLAARRRRRRIERFIVVSLFFMCVGCVIWYFTSYTKTPNYAINETVEALKENDAETFRKHIDFTTVLTKAYDDLTVDLFKYDTQLSERERSLFENFYVLIRPQMCQGAIKVINTRLDTGRWTLPEGMLKGRQLGIDYDLLLERSLIRHTTIVGVENVEHLGNRAVADIKVVEDYSQIPFVLKVTLENVGGKGLHVAEKEINIFGQNFKFAGLSFNFRASDWKIISVDNYKEYLDAVSPALRKDLAEYIDATTEIVRRYNNIFRSEQNTFIYAQRTSNGMLSYNQKNNVAYYISETIIPNLKNRQAELDEIYVPHGALYLAGLRKESTEVTIQAWQSYVRGLLENNSAAFDTAETLLKQELILDQRIEEIVHSSAVARNLPDLP